MEAATLEMVYTMEQVKVVLAVSRFENYSIIKDDQKHFTFPC